jgi:hypothetical protein
MLLGMNAGSIRRVEEHGGRRRLAAEGTIIADIGPDPPGTGLSLRQHRHGGVVAMDALGGEHVRLDQLVERPQRGRAGADMIGHRRDRQLDPLAPKLLALPVERLMVGVLLDQHHRQQARAGKAAGDRVERRRRLADRLARAAAELLADMLGHEPLPRHDVEGLGDVLADLREPGAAAARTGSRRRMDHAPPRQMLGDVPARRLAPRKTLDLDARRLGLRRILARRRGQFLELQLQLIEQALAALRARAEHVALHLGDHQLKMLDHRFGAGELGARLDQGCLQLIFVVGKRIGRGRHDATGSQSARFADLVLTPESTRRTQPSTKLSLPPMAARCEADCANRCLRACSRAAPT